MKPFSPHRGPHEFLINHACLLSSQPTIVTAWLMRQDIAVIHGRPSHPQGRGKLERFHRTLKLEVLQERQFANLGESQVAFDAWRETYNLRRPHEALELAVPASRYRVSERVYQEPTQAYEYSSRFEMASRRNEEQGEIG